MNKYRLGVVVLFVVAFVLVMAGQAMAMPAVEIGGLDHYTTATYTYTSSDAGWTNTFGYTVDGNTMMLGNNKDTEPGATYDLGTLAPGSTITVVDVAAEPLRRVVVDKEAWDETVWVTGTSHGKPVTGDGQAKLFQDRQHFDGYTQVVVSHIEQCTVIDGYKYSKTCDGKTYWVTGIDRRTVKTSTDSSKAKVFEDEQHLDGYTKVVVSHVVSKTVVDGYEYYKVVCHPAVWHWEYYTVDHTWTSDSSNAKVTHAGQTYTVKFEDTPLWRADKDFNDMVCTVTLTNVTGSLHIVGSTSSNLMGTLGNISAAITYPNGTTITYKVPAVDLSSVRLDKALGDQYGAYTVVVSDSWRGKSTTTSFVYQGLDTTISFTEAIFEFNVQYFYTYQYFGTKGNCALLADTAAGHGYKAIKFGASAGPDDWRVGEVMMGVPTGTYTNAQHDVWLNK